jgi:hypothetical protein
MRVSPLHLERDAVHLDEASHAVPVLNFGHDYERYVAEHCTPGAPGRLVTMAESQDDWKVWEMHPALRRATRSSSSYAGARPSSSAYPMATSPWKSARTRP